MPERLIVHLDMDAFFASIEQRDDPRLRGKPVIVGADPKKGRGVVSTCSYEARGYGVRSAMPIAQAFALCPQGVYLPVDMEKYCLVSQRIFDILDEFSPQVEPVSIDEAFLDISSTYRLFSSAHNACLMLKSRIKEATALTASIGLAPTRMAAKIASDLGKPDGLVEVSQDRLLDFLRPLDAGKIWGLGEKSRQKLAGMGINTIGELAQTRPDELAALFGKNGVYFWRLANGRDESEVQAASQAKSVSNETTFEKDTWDEQLITGELARLSAQVSRRLRKSSLKCRTLTLKLRLCGFLTYTRSATLNQATNRTDTIFGQIKRLYQQFKKDRKVRLVGVKAANLCAADAGEELFLDPAGMKKEAVDKAIDRIKDRFGEEGIYLAVSKSRAKDVSRRLTGLKSG
jgi:nucleotidyltransferase/DNA polymerase involved in DNA repair